LKHVTFQPGYSQWGGKMRRLNVDARTVHYLKIRCQELIVRDIFLELPMLWRIQGAEIQSAGIGLGTPIDFEIQLQADVCELAPCRSNHKRIAAFLTTRGAWLGQRFRRVVHAFTSGMCGLRLPCHASVGGAICGG
jgi:hypothetical protein